MAVRLLKSALEDESEDAMSAYDNICGFLMKAGHCVH
jgi:hypothetical protein